MNKEATVGCIPEAFLGCLPIQQSIYPQDPTNQHPALKDVGQKINAGYERMQRIEKRQQVEETLVT